MAARSLALPLLFALLLAAAAAADAPFLIAHKKVALSRPKPGVERLAVSLDLYNQGSATAYDVTINDDTWPKESFELISGEISKTLERLDPGATASHTFVLETKVQGRFQGSPAVITYRVPTKAVLQEAYSTPILPLDILAERPPEKKFEWPTRKRPRPAADQPSTYHHQIPQFAPHIPPIPTPPMPTIFHHMPLSLPFLPQEASSTALSAAAATSCTPTATGQTNYIPGCTSDLSGNNINTIGNNNALADIVDGNNSVVTGHSCPLPVANSNEPAIATTVELNHILPKGAETNTIRASRTANSCVDNDVAAAAIGVDDGQQQQQQQKKETTIDDHQNVVHESVGAETIVAAGVEGNEYNIGEDEIEVFDESLLDRFLEEIPIDDDLLSPDTTSADFLSFIDTIPDIEEWINDPYFLDDVFSNPSTSSK